MRLLPFDRAYAQDILSIYSDSFYASFSRGVGRFLTFDECSNLPQVLGYEVLIIDNNGFAGLACLQEDQGKIFKWGLAIKDRSQKIGSKAQEVLEAYATRFRGARLLITEIVDSYLGSHLEKTGYKKCGVIPKRDFVLGEYRDVSIYCKEV